MTTFEVFQAAMVWNPDTQQATVDMDRARAIQRDRLRGLRAPLLVANDVTLRDAMVDGDTQRRNAAIRRRDELRDVTKYTAIDGAKTLEELWKAVPKILTE